MTSSTVGAICGASATELAHAISSGVVSALELVDAAIERIETLDGPINAVVVRDFDRARDAARAADRAVSRGERGALLGVPMTVKEAHHVAGLPTTWGLPYFKDWIASEDSLAARRLKAAGAIIVGKTNVPPLLIDWQTENPLHGRTHNPWDVSRTPGGSSGGSAAAVAAGMVPLELGSDICGSIRIPAAFCGVFGHKPSYGIIPTRDFALPGREGVDRCLGVIGPLARTAADLELALDVLAGPVEEEAAGYRLALPRARHACLKHYRVLVLTEHPVAALDGEIEQALRGIAAWLEAVGADVEYGTEPLPDLTKIHRIFLAMLEIVTSRGSAPQSKMASAHEWMALQDAQLSVCRRWSAVFDRFDVVLAPAFGTAAFPHDDRREIRQRTLTIHHEETPYRAQAAWSGLASLANLPATAVPIGRTAGGLPVGMQVIGPYLEDRTTLGFARLIEREFDLSGARAGAPVDVVAAA